MNKDKYIKQLEKMIILITTERDEALERIKDLEKKLEKATNKLKIYENPHTPPSMQPVKKKKKKKPSKTDPTPKRRGAPKGHRGATRTKPIPDEIKHVTVKRCPKCNKKLGKPIRTETKIIEDLPSPQKIKVTQFELDVYHCKNCDLEVRAKHEDCPQKGNFGIFLLVYITMLKFHLRGVIRKVQEFVAHNNLFEISVMGINNILLRVADACKTTYNQIIGRIREAKWVHIDETGMKVNGEKWWLWIFRSSEDDILVVIRKSRGSTVVQEILGKDFKGPVIVDGWRAYEWIGIVQRCWSHLLREVDAYTKESRNGKRLSKEIHMKFDALKDFLDKNPSMRKRKQQKVIFDEEMEGIVRRYSKYEELEQPLTYIRRGLGNWYTCVLYPGMQPTNNLGEQAIREHVIIRKIIGTFRSVNGSQNYQYIASMLATWKLQDKNIFEELEHLLREELCLK